ncbi:MAG: A24 family peptidase [Pseudomonadota bacterium]
MSALIDALAAHPALLVSTIALLGLLVGSFLNVVIHRLPRMMEADWRQQCAELTGQEASTEPTAPYNLVVPRSACPACGHQITALENIPIISWLMLRGRCSACNTPISARYPLVELATAVLSALVAVRFGASAEMLLALAITWALLALALIDFDTTYLPDSITQPLLWAALLTSLWGGGELTREALALSPSSAITGAIAGYLSLWSVYMGFKLLTGKEGMGFGDFKLLAALGAWLGWLALPLIVLLSAVVGATVGIALIASGKLSRDKPMPFGPFLAAAGWLAMLYGEQLTAFYLR